MNPHKYLGLLAVLALVLYAVPMIYFMPGKVEVFDWEYRACAAYVRENPELRSTVQEFMNDGKITRGELNGLKMQIARKELLAAIRKD